MSLRNFSWYIVTFTARKMKFAKVMFSQVFVCPQGRVFVSVQVGLHPGGVSVQEGFCLGGSLSRGSLFSKGSLSTGLSVQGVSVQVDTCPGVFVRETPHMVTSGWYTSYWNALLYDIITLKIPTASGRKPSNIQSWMQILNLSTFAKPVMSQFQPLWIS